MAELSRAVQDDLEALRRSYVASLPSKLRDLERAAEALAAGPDRERINALYLLAHRLTGSSAIYGFAGISRASGELEVYLLAALEGVVAPSAEWAEGLRGLVDAVSRAYASERPRPQVPR